MVNYNNKAAKIIRKIRINKNLTQEDIANAIGLTKAAYSRLETGNTQLTINVLYAICIFLEISVAEVLALENKKYFQNTNSVVMTDFQNGTLNIQISSDELKQILSKKRGNKG